MEPHQKDQESLLKQHRFEHFCGINSWLFYSVYETTHVQDHLDNYAEYSKITSVWFEGFTVFDEEGFKLPVPFKCWKILAKCQHIFMFPKRNLAQKGLMSELERISLLLLCQQTFESTRGAICTFLWQSWYHHVYRCDVLTHLPLVTHICMGKLGQHWFK